MNFWAGQVELTVLQWGLRATVIFLWLLFIAKLMGQREIGRLTLFDFVIAISIGSIAATPAANAETGLKGPLSSIAVLGGLNILIAWLALHAPVFRRIVQEEPVVLVKDGKILDHVLFRTRMNLDDLLSALRIQKFPSLADVAYAILEPNGMVSVIPRSHARPLTPRDLQLTTAAEGMPVILVEDGNIIADNMAEKGISRKWLEGELAKRGIDSSQVFIAMLDAKGQFYISEKGQAKFRA